MVLSSLGERKQFKKPEKKAREETGAHKNDSNPYHPALPSEACA
jgi:hypothetical protein